MTAPEEATTLSPTRRRATRVVDIIFAATLAISFLLGIVLVLIQLIGLIVGARDLVVNVSDILGYPCFAAAAAAGVLSLVAMYLHGWKDVE